MRTAASSPLAARSSAASNMRSTSSASRMRGNGRSSRGRGSAADGSSFRKPSSTRKPKNRRSAAERRATVDGASSAQAAPSRDTSSTDAVRQACKALGGALKIVAVGVKVCREEPASAAIMSRKRSTKRSVVRGSRRDRASAAIIRAVNPCPVRLSAATA